MAQTIKTSDDTFLFIKTNIITANGVLSHTHLIRNDVFEALIGDDEFELETEIISVKSNELNEYEQIAINNATYSDRWNVMEEYNVDGEYHIAML